MLLELYGILTIVNGKPSLLSKRPTWNLPSLIFRSKSKKIFFQVTGVLLDKCHEKTFKLSSIIYCIKDIDRSFLYIFLIKKFHRNIVFFAYESIYHWKGNYIVLNLVKILLKKISYFGYY